MSDSYEINGVKVTAAGGGYYDLEHGSLADPERVRGKEAADKRAEEIGKAALSSSGGSNDGSAPRGDTPALNSEGEDGLIPAQRFPGADTEAAQAQAETGKEPKAPEADKDSEIAALKAQLAEQTKRADDLAKKAQPLADVLADQNEEAEQVDGRVPNSIPREYRGELDKDARAALKKAGVKTTKIILEENPDIPPTGLFLGHNGRGYMISPGEEVEVPDFLLGVLDDAVMSAPQVDSKTQKVLGYRSRMKYPYRRV